MDVISHKDNPCVNEQQGRVTETYYMCDRFLRNLEFTTQISKERSIQIRQLVDDIYDLIPEKKMTGLKQSKRAILPVIGDLMHSLFGVPAQGDVDTLSANVLKLTEQYDHDLGMMKKTVTDL